MKIIDVGYNRGPEFDPVGTDDQGFLDHIYGQGEFRLWVEFDAPIVGGAWYEALMSAAMPLHVGQARNQ